MREASIEKRLRKKIRKIGGEALKFTSPGMNGVPDRLVLLPGGRAIFIELKTINGKLSRIQEVRIRQLKKLGFRVECFNSISQIDQFIEEVGYNE